MIANREFDLCWCGRPNPCPSKHDRLPPPKPPKRRKGDKP